MVIRATNQTAKTSTPTGDTMKTFPVGARVYVDGEQLATIAQVFPEGSSSLMGPHYCVRFDGGDGGQVKVSMKRIGVVKKGSKP
jgi:hypothetical protein